MRIRDIITITIITLFSAAMMRSDVEREAPAAPETTPPVETTAEAPAELANLLALAQDAPLPAANGVNVHLHQIQPAPAAPPAQVSREFLDECMEVAEQIDPEWALRMRDFCEKSPEDFEKFIRQSGRRIAALVELKRRDPALYETRILELRLEAQISRTVHELRRMHADGRFDSIESVELQEELRGMVQNQVAYSLKARGDYLVRLTVGNTVQTKTLRIEEHVPGYMGR